MRINRSPGFFASNRKHKQIISLLLLFAFINLLGCNYYKVRKMPVEEETLTKTVKKKHYIMVHADDAVWHLSGVVFDKDQQTISGVIAAVDPKHESYKTAKERGSKRYHGSKQSPTTEMHLHVGGNFKPDTKAVIPVSSISKIEVYDQNTGLTILTVFSFVASAVALFGIIVALTKSSCPFVYIDNGKSYVFTGEMYGGAIYPTLERDDYMPLPNLANNENEYRLAITNELLEKQYTNLAELMVVSHPFGTKVLLDKNGNIQTIEAPKPPIEATADDGRSYLTNLIAVDTISHLFANAGSDDINKHIEITFEKPALARQAKLILNAKNSLWLDYVYGEFNEQFGTLYNRFAEKQAKKPAQEMKTWSLQQNIPLSVYVETKQGWKFVDHFDVVGPLASRDLVMPVDLSGVDGNKVKVRLQCGFMFWEVDYAAMDFSENCKVHLEQMKPVRAIDETGKDVTASLAGADNDYLVQTEVGNEVKVAYRAAPVIAHAHYQRTAFLHSRGYYTYIRDYKNKPNLKYLKSFKKPGAFTRFSKERFDAIMQKNEIVLTSDEIEHP